MGMKGLSPHDMSGDGGGDADGETWTPIEHQCSPATLTKG